MLVIVMGYYGYDNAGDDALLEQTVNCLNDIDVTAIVVPSGPCAVPYASFNRWSVRMWWRYLRRARVVVFGGGSIFQSKTSLLSLIYYLVVIQAARWFGCRVVTFCHGWGPFRRPWHERLAMIGLRHARRSWRIPTPPFSGDASFCDATFFGPRHRPVSGHNVVGVGLRDQSTQHRLVSYLESHNIPVLTLQSQTGDAPADYRLIDYWHAPPQPIGLLITDRYHGAIWASRFGIAWVSISDDPKLMDLATQADQINYSSVQDCMNHMNDWPWHTGEALWAWANRQANKKDPALRWLHEHITH